MRDSPSPNVVGIPGIRGAIANGLAILIFLAALAAASRRSIADYTIVFKSSPLDIVPAGHWARIALVKSHVPPGPILYLTEKKEDWQRGLWQRTLYPDYPVVTAFGVNDLTSPRILKRRHDDNINYVVSAGDPPPNPGFEWRMDLPLYVNGIPMILGRLKPE